MRVLILSIIIVSLFGCDSRKKTHSYRRATSTATNESNEIRELYENKIAPDLHTDFPEVFMLTNFLWRLAIKRSPVFLLFDANFQLHIFINLYVDILTIIYTTAADKIGEDYDNAMPGLSVLYTAYKNAEEEICNDGRTVRSSVEGGHRRRQNKEITDGISKKDVDSFARFLTEQRATPFTCLTYYDENYPDSRDRILDATVTGFASGVSGGGFLKLMQKAAQRSKNIRPIGLLAWCGTIGVIGAANGFVGQANKEIFPVRLTCDEMLDAAQFVPKIFHRQGWGTIDPIEYTKFMKVVKDLPPVFKKTTSLMEETGVMINNVESLVKDVKSGNVVDMSQRISNTVQVAGQVITGVAALEPDLKNLGNDASLTNVHTSNLKSGSTNKWWWWW